MKPKLIEFIPFYGMLKYFKRYFDAEKRTAKEAKNAMWFEIYHFVTTIPILIYIIGKIFFTL